MNQKTVVHLHSGILHSRKKEGTPTFSDSMDGTGEYYLGETNQSVKDKYHIISPIRGINEQNKLMNKIEPQAWKHGTD